MTEAGKGCYSLSANQPANAAHSIVTPPARGALPSPIFVSFASPSPTSTTHNNIPSIDHWLSFILNRDLFSLALHVRSTRLYIYAGPMEREHTPAVTQTAFTPARLRWNATEQMGRGVWRMEE
ncbi:hypothetical protein BDQ17DRAFT_1426820 [Cyathus striatus]|nr:hypothetical protein BDQ17DRAFT_1426820 [Cyathus striatus]